MHTGARTTIAAATAAFLIGGIAGYLVNSAPSEADRILARYPVDLSGAGSHAHDISDVAEGRPIPEISLEVIPDTMKEREYILHLRTDNFSFSPENVSREDIPGEGHAHVFIDDVKIGRAYSPWFHIPKLKPGVREVKVTLNRNRHQEYSVDGLSVIATATIEVPE